MNCEHIIGVGLWTGATAICAISHHTIAFLCKKRGLDTTSCKPNGLIGKYMLSLNLVPAGLLTAATRELHGNFIQNCGAIVPVHSKNPYNTIAKGDFIEAMEVPETSEITKKSPLYACTMQARMLLQRIVR